MLRRSPVAALLLTLGLGLATTGCDLRPEDLTRARAAAASFHETWTRRVSEIEIRHTRLRDRARALPPDAEGMADLMSELNGTRPRIDAFRDRAAAVRDQAFDGLRAHKRDLAVQTLTAGEAELQGMLDDLTEALDVSAQRIEAIEQQQKAAAAAAAADAAATLPVTDIASPAFARATGTADLPDIKFKLGTAEFDTTLPGTVASLDKLVALASACDEIRLRISGHTAGDGNPDVNQRLSLSQANAVLAQLTARGVLGRKLSAEGVGATQPRLPEPAPGSAEEQAMPTAKLAALRAANRRISVTVLTPCAP
ncbi:MAG: OmpA family protein [Kofleriaceae bacterium]|nr:OmpA family protein [Kofleriaceae bacterium]MCB9574003.1 OmpA family protein [Kofleriaceae bacterium]